MIVCQQPRDQGVADARWWSQALRRNRWGGSGLWCRPRAGGPGRGCRPGSAGLVRPAWFGRSGAIRRHRGWPEPGQVWPPRR